MKRTILIFAVSLFLTIQNYAQTVSDIDGNVYDTVIIGTQIWMKENLKVTHYQNGVKIPNVTDSTIWLNTSIGSRCYYNNDSSLYADVYGALYNWYAVNDSCNICPLSFRVPNNNDWTILKNYLGGTNFVGGKLKEKATIHWHSPNVGATDSVGFTALPGGIRGYLYMEIGYFGQWWSSTEYNTLSAWFRAIKNNSDILFPVNGGKGSGFSVRCVKDTWSQINENNNSKIKIYPNPATDNIIIDNLYSQNLNLSIYNTFGQLLLQNEISQNKIEIDVSTLSSGLYIIKVTGVDWTAQKKIIKE
jgi:uncharacterized protein (TIGR02145 family)